MGRHERQRRQHWRREQQHAALRSRLCPRDDDDDDGPGSSFFPLEEKAAAASTPPPTSSAYSGPCWEEKEADMLPGKLKLNRWCAGGCDWPAGIAAAACAWAGAPLRGGQGPARRGAAPVEAAEEVHLREQHRRLHGRLPAPAVGQVVEGQRRRVGPLLRRLLRRRLLPLQVRDRGGRRRPRRRRELPAARSWRRGGTWAGAGGCRGSCTGPARAAGPFPPWPRAGAAGGAGVGGGRPASGWPPSQLLLLLPRPCRWR